MLIIKVLLVAIVAITGYIGMKINEIAKIMSDMDKETPDEYPDYNDWLRRQRGY